jgi:hypothetical protein
MVFEMGMEREMAWGILTMLWRVSNCSRSAGLGQHGRSTPGSSMASLRLKKVLGEVFLLDPGEAKGKMMVQQHVGGILQQGLVVLLLPSSSFLFLLSSPCSFSVLFLVVRMRDMERAGGVGVCG